MGKGTGKPYDYTSSLSWQSFQAMVQDKRTQVEPGTLSELRIIQISESKEIKAASVYRAGYQRRLSYIENFEYLQNIDHHVCVRKLPGPR